MSLRNQSLVSEVQLALDLTKEEINQETDCTDYTDENDELLNLLAEILESEFCAKPDDSLEIMEEKFIYNLDSEKDIQVRERYEQEVLDGGSASLDKLDELEQQAKVYFSNPRIYPLNETDNDSAWVTAYVQQFKGASFESNGNLKENWRTIGRKIVFGFDDLFYPEKIIALAEANGYVLNDTLRMVIYSPSLEKLIGSQIYQGKCPKDLVPLVEGNFQILLTIPDTADCPEEESISEWVDRLVNESILYGTQPEICKMSLSHWSLSKAREEEVIQEELEINNLLQFSKKERNFTQRQNEFMDRYKEGRDFIIGINSGKELSKALYSMKLSVLEDILYLSEKCGERINNSTVYIQVRSLASKLRLQILKESNSQALSIIQKINKGELVEVHLLSLTVLEEVFSVLWSSNLGIKILPEKKDFYFQLKSRLLRLRSAKSGKSA